MTEPKVPFQTGDVVRLKSGGADMTVVNCTDQEVYCTWFDDGDVKGHTFRPDMLFGSKLRTGNFVLDMSFLPPLAVPMDIIQFATSKEGLGLSLYPVQQIVLKMIYGLELDSVAVFSLRRNMDGETLPMTEKSYVEYLYNRGRANTTKTGFNKAILSLGRLSGKTFLISVINAYELYCVLFKVSPQGYYRMPTGIDIHLQNVSDSRDNAQATLARTKSLLARPERLLQRGVYVGSGFGYQTLADMHLQGRDPSRVQVRMNFQSSEVQQVKDSKNLLVVLEEPAFYQGDRAQVLYDTLMPSTTSFFNAEDQDKLDSHLLLIGSPHPEGNPFFMSQYWNRFHTGFGLCLQIPTWEMNPNISLRNLREHRENSKPGVFESEFGANIQG